MQGQIRASGINRISQIPRTNLAPVDDPAKAILYLCTPLADDLAAGKYRCETPSSVAGRDWWWTN